jgi:UDP-N-acetylmuramate--alanine ligase
VAVLETGTFGHPGDLKFMVKRSRPGCGIITNITPDHMHNGQNFLKYAEIKGEFVDYLKNKKLIVNGDDPTVWGLIKSNIPDYKDKNIITFGVDLKTDIVNDKLCWCGREIPVKETVSGMGDYHCPCGLEKPAIRYQATDIKENSFSLHTPQDVVEVINPLLGLHNIYNILGAIAAAVEFFNIPLDEITSYIKSFSGVPGRLDYLGEYQDKIIIIDYAHNPGGVETVLRELKKIYENIAVVITVSSESGEQGNIDILNKCLENADYVIPASYYSRRAADKYLNQNINPKSQSLKIILTPKYPEEFKNGTLGANLDQITAGLETALLEDVEAVICIGEAAFKYKENIQKIIL